MIGILVFAAAMDILANCRAMLPAEPVTMKGETFLILGEGRYPIEVDENDVPTAIYGYYSEPLT